MIRSNIIPNLIRSNSISLMDLSGKKTASLRPIASYKCYDKTNEDEDRSVLRDLTGNGHDIQLYNFAFAESSGYGKYAVNWNNFYKYNQGGDIRAYFTVTSNKIIITNIIRPNVSFIEKIGDNLIPSFKIKVTGLTNYDATLTYKAEPDESNLKFVQIVKDGIYKLPASEISGNYRGGFAINKAGACNITIEQIPDYQGALVSDGVDDYGWCENFPILTKENGYTVCAIRKWISFGALKSLLTNNNSETFADSAFVFEAVAANLNYQTSSFGSISTIKDGFGNSTFSYQKSNSYNGNSINVGYSNGKNVLYLFGNTSRLSNAAIYALEIYDRDLTDEEIAKVKARMIAEYEAKTGDVSMSVIASYECYDKTNEDSDRDILTDLSGNGHDINLKYFLFSEGSGYGKYATDFKLFKLYNSGTNAGIGDYRCEGSIISNSKVHITNVYLAVNAVFEYKPLIKFPSYKIKVTGLNNGKTLRYRAEIDTKNVSMFNITEDGIYTLPAATTETQFQSAFYITSNGECDITIEQIPEYKGALVSDGVDDYGLCDNFPILTKDKGYTICVIRQWVNYLKTNSVFLSNGNNNVGAFKLETHLPNDSVVYRTYSFGRSNTLNEFDKNMFIYQTANKYNGNAIVTGDANGINELKLFCNESNNWRSSVALYALEIYDRDLTDKEIEVVKERMIKRYEEKTGNKYEEVTE